MSAISGPVDIGMDLRPDGTALQRVATTVLADWAVPQAEADRIVTAIDSMHGEVATRCGLPARVRTELSHAWPVVTLLLRCRDVLVIEYFDVSGFLLGLPTEAAR